MLSTKSSMMILARCCGVATIPYLDPTGLQCYHRSYIVRCRAYIRLEVTPYTVLCMSGLGGVQEESPQDHLLGVAVGAEESVLKKAYYRLALKCHPDKGGDAKRFQVIRDAYEVLMGPLRALYDACGEEGLEFKKQAKPQVRNSMRRDHICFVLFIFIVGELSRIQPYVRRPRL